ncbi:MAG: hypothetical protein AVDCRST_MAG04-2482, partial [uncultured Acetobacteraceae bacterium]
ASRNRKDHVPLSGGPSAPAIRRPRQRRRDPDGRDNSVATPV